MLIVRVIVLWLLCIVTANAEFSIQPLNPASIERLKREKLWQPTCPIPLSRLRDVRIDYVDFNDKEHQNGHLIVLDAAAKSVMAIFQKLHQERFPLDKVVPISVYHGDDNASMKDNNTSAFNCRPVTGGVLPSLHAYGLAIDINPVQNPYVKVTDLEQGLVQVLPVKGLGHLNRELKQLGFAQDALQAMSAHGFSIWGGQWHDPIDYQHFQTSRLLAQLLALLSTEKAQALFDLAEQHPADFAKLSEDDYPIFAEAYRKHERHFIHLIEKHWEVLHDQGAAAFLEKMRSGA